MSRHQHSLDCSLAVVLGLSGATLCGDAIPAGVNPIIQTIAERALSGDYRLRKAVWRTFRGVEALQDQTQTLRISVKQAVVTLSGSVEQPLQKLAAGKSAESVQGITKVIDAITAQLRPFQAERETLRRTGTRGTPVKTRRDRVAAGDTHPYQPHIS